MTHTLLTYKTATEQEEIEQIHRLIYRTFVEEIPQHPPNQEKRLVDRFHNENTYFICLDGRRVVGMMAMRAKRPFSLDGKVADLDSYLPHNSSICELRLLAVESEYRKPGLLAQLIRYAAEECIKCGHTLAVASGTLRQTRLYARMGFVSFAQPVGTAKALFQPMYLTLHTAQELFERIGKPLPETFAKVSFMPGPVEISRSVHQAFSASPESHRSDTFLETVADVKRRLCALTTASGVELLLGSGTLGNDVVAAHLKLLDGCGLLLSNGEFGDRLIDHAERQGLSFDLLRFPWGTPYDLESVEGLLSERRDISWLWTVHCETSSGLLNDLGRLKAICKKNGVLLCLDCTSSLGTVAADLSGIYLATSVSGKGLASLPGIALVFYNHEVVPDRRLPRYLDLGYYREKQGVPFTHSSNLSTALYQALLELDASTRYDHILYCHAWLRNKLEKAGFSIIAVEDHASPAVMSIPLPPALSSFKLGEEMEKQGFLLSFRSSYLLERNIIQICLMGNVSFRDCKRMMGVFLEMTGKCENK